MIYFINNCFSTTRTMFSQEIGTYLLGDKYSSTNDFFQTELGEPIQQEGIDEECEFLARWLRNSFSNERIKKETVLAYCSFSKYAIPYLVGDFGRRYVKFYNIIRNTKDFYQVFNPKQYKGIRERAYTSIYCLFDCVDNAHDSINNPNVTTIYFDQIVKEQFSPLEQKINDLKDFDDYRQRWEANKDKWDDVTSDRLTVEQAFGRI